MPKLSNIKRHAGIAGDYSISVDVQYPGEQSERVTFVSSVYGPPIVMLMPRGQQVFVSQRVTDRIGSKLTPEWVRAFFTSDGSE
jgi:hypothetical protein